MRFRSTKPEFWRSERIASVDWETRLVLKGLESFVDDNGVGKDDLALIVADVFPRDLSRSPTGTLRKVSEALGRLQDAGLLWRYEHDGTRLLYVSFWESIQRIEKPTKGRFRRPDGTLNYRDSTIGASFPEPSRNPPGTLRPGTGEQGNRGTGEKDSSSPPPSASLAPVRSASSADADAEFEAWWKQYPRKVGKGDARTKYRSARKLASRSDLIDALNAQTPALMARGVEFCPHPATWLHQGRWADEPPVISASNGKPSAPDATVAAFLARQESRR